MRRTFMKVESLYIGELRRLTRLNQETISLNEGSRVIDMIDKLTDAYGNDFRLHLDKENSYVILINGRHYEILDGMQTVLKEGDKVVFMPITMGG